MRKRNILLRLLYSKVYLSIRCPYLTEKVNCRPVSNCYHCKDKHYKKRNSSINYSSKAPKVYITWMKYSSHQCLLNGNVSKIGIQDKLFRERSYCQTKHESCVDFTRPNSVQIENWVSLEKQHFPQFCTIVFTEILHKCQEMVFLKFDIWTSMICYVDFDLCDLCEVGCTLFGDTL